jgi:hypothetical protein
MGRRSKVSLVGASVLALALAYSGAASADEGPGCAFPAQDVQPTRTVSITNTAPPVDGVETDVCGNVVGHKEQMTKTLTAGPWVPAGANLTAGEEPSDYRWNPFLNNWR